MKKIYASVMLCAAGISAMAQQLPNNGFETGWGDCTPWTSGNNTKTKGTTPSPWTIAQVIGMGGTGATIVGEETAGCNSAKAVKVINTANSVAASQIVPGYFSLGKTWSTAVGTAAKNADGGVWGGLEFTCRPDAITFDYKREVSGSDVPATVVAYLWKGRTSQADVPGDIGLFSASKCTMVNRDRNILGMQTAQGGAVTKSSDFSLIATVNKEITDKTSDWKTATFEFDYKNNDVPAMINVIFSAGQYFESANIQKGNSLSVDNVKLVYYSRLASLTGVSGFAPDKYEYDLGELTAKPSATQFGFSTMGRTSEAKVAVTENAATITVTNVGEDIDGKTQHVYTIRYSIKGEAPAPQPGDDPEIPADAPRYAGYLNGEMMGETLMEDDPATIIITEPKDGKCIFALKDFNFQGMNLGDIIIPDVTVTPANGVTTYEGARNGLKLAEGQIDCNVTVKGTATDAGKLNFAISVMWVMDENTQIPIDVTFTTDPQASIAEITANGSKAAIYDLQGRKVLAPARGIYIINGKKVRI